MQCFILFVVTVVGAANAQMYLNQPVSSIMRKRDYLLNW